MGVKPNNSFLLQWQQNCSSREYTVVSDHQIIMMIVLSSNLTFFSQFFRKLKLNMLNVLLGNYVQLLLDYLNNTFLTVFMKKKLRNDAKEKN